MFSAISEAQTVTCPDVVEVVSWYTSIKSTVRGTS